MIDPVLIERRGTIAIVTLNVPNKRNAIGKALYSELPRILNELQDDPGVNALVLSGGKQFCAGGDLSTLDEPPLQMRAGMAMGHRAVRTLVGGNLPVVAAVEGNAFGAGFSLAMACDFVVGDENSRFCAAFGRVGLCPDYGLLWSLPQRVGMGRTKEILMLCDVIDGRTALAEGLLDRLSETGKVLDTAIALAERLAAAPPASIRTTKAVLSRLPLNLDTMLAWEADTQALLVRTEDFAEGVRAFQEKRTPHFNGR